MNIASLEIGGSNPCRTVAEISGNHNGDYARLLRLIVAAQTAGADAVKFQCYTVEELVALRGDGPAPAPWGEQGYTMRTLYERARTPLDWFPALARYCTEIGMPWFSSVFGLTSLACLEAVGCPAYKIARLDNQHRDLAEAVCSRRKPVLVSADAFPMNLLTPYELPVTWLYCPPGYPTPLPSVHLSRFARDESEPRWLGLSSHCLAPELPIAAVARGAKLLEYHMQLDDEPSELEACVSLTASQFRAMVQSVRTTELLLT